MTSILNTSVRVDREAERLYFCDGAVSVDLNCDAEKRKAVLELLAQAQEMVWALRPLANTQCEGQADCGGHRGGLCPSCHARAVLRDAGVIP